ncbi:hypothetical protein LPN04_31525 [Rugamonas sp. A1-17]|nr:hypothetical protein [Rugamonas sp. A1-17]
MSTPENTTTINAAAMLAFKAPTALFGLVASPAVQNAIRPLPSRQYGGSPISVSYLAANTKNPPESETPAQFELDASDLIDGQEQLSGFFEHEALAHLCVAVEEEQVKADAAIGLAASSIVSVAPTQPVVLPATLSNPLADTATQPVVVSIEPLEVVPKMIRPAELEEPAKSDSPVFQFRSFPRKKVLAFAICGGLLPFALAGAGLLYDQSHARAVAPKTVQSENQQLRNRTPALTKPAQTPAVAIAPAAQLPVPAAPAGQMTIPRVASTVLPLPLPMSAPQMIEAQVSVQNHSAKSAAPAAAQEKNKIILLEVEEPIAQKEDIPSPGKFVLLKTDNKPAPSKLKVLGDKQP